MTRRVLFVSWRPVLSCAVLAQQADQADLRAFEAATASARSQGLFFKNLYQPDLDEEQQEAGSSSAAGSSGSSRSRAPLDPAAARKAAAVVTSSAEEEVSSPFRMYLFGAMAAVLALVVGQGTTTGVYSRRGCMPRPEGECWAACVGLLVKGCCELTSSAEEELSSPFRMYLFGAMAAVLAVVVG
jgi:hypothetical protein